MERISADAKEGYVQVLFQKLSEIVSINIINVEKYS